MTSRLQQRRDTAANWTSNNPILAAGEIGLETDTAAFKIGNGSTAWTSLAYANGITATSTTTLTNKTLTAPVIVQSINAQTGTTYTLALSDDAALVTLSNAASIAVTVPLNSSVAFPIGACVDLAQEGAGQVTITGASGVTILSNAATAATPKTRVQYSAATLRKVGTDSWRAYGDIA